jgi:hypothetical protein
MTEVLHGLLIGVSIGGIGLILFPEGGNGWRYWLFGILFTIILMNIK